MASSPSDIPDLGRGIPLTQMWPREKGGDLFDGIIHREGKVWKEGIPGQAVNQMQNLCLLITLQRLSPPPKKKKYFYQRTAKVLN
jgi:hypothetical protein